MGTIFTGFVLFGMVCAIILEIRRDMKKNKCAGCSCNCSRFTIFPPQCSNSKT